MQLNIDPTFEITHQAPKKSYVSHLMSRDGSSVPTPHAPEWVSAGDLRSVVAQPLNSRVSLNCRASGQPPPSIRWTKDGLALNQTFEEGLDFKVQSSMFCEEEPVMQRPSRTNQQF